MEIEYICSPSYFQAGDLLFDIYNVIILVLISIFSFYAYRCISSNTGVCNKRFLLIGFSFLVLAFAFAVKGFSDFNLAGTSTHAINSITITMTTMSFETICAIGGFIVHRIITLIALLMLFLLVMKNQKYSIPSLTVVALVLLNMLAFSHNFVMFSLTSAILLFAIGFSYFKDYLISKNNNQKLISLSFIVVAFSYLIFALLEHYQDFYVIAKLLRAVGFTLLLVSFMRVFYHGKKKK